MTQHSNKTATTLDAAWVREASAMLTATRERPNDVVDFVREADGAFVLAADEAEVFDRLRAERPNERADVLVGEAIVEVARRRRQGR